MKITEKKLLDNYCGVMHTGEFISCVDGKYFYWNYYYITSKFNAQVKKREDGNIIKISTRKNDNSDDFIEIAIHVPQKCMNKEAVKKIEYDYFYYELSKECASGKASALEFKKD